MKMTKLTDSMASKQPAATSNQPITNLQNTLGIESKPKILTGPSRQAHFAPDIWISVWSVRGHAWLKCYTIAPFCSICLYFSFGNDQRCTGHFTVVKTLAGSQVAF